MKKTAIVILNWNGTRLLQQFLPTVLHHSALPNTEVIVADNGSTDDSIAVLKSQFPTVPLIIFDKNYGFAEGYNKAIEAVDTEYVVLLNSDVETTENWLSPLIDYLDAHPDVAAVQPKILSQREKHKFEYAGACGGFIDKFGYPFCRGRILDNVEEDHGQYDNAVPIFWASGACLCIRRAAFLETGGFDSGFFAHMEEIDLCWRLNARGQKLVCIPDAVVYHVGGASLDKNSPRKLFLNFRNNLLMIYKNVAPERMTRVFFVRYLLDALAMCHLLVTGKPVHAFAVVRAHKAFRTMKPTYRKKRDENIRQTTVWNIPTEYKKSILWDYYFRRKRIFSRIFDQKSK